MQAITANDLTGGHVVFLTSVGTWSKYVADAAVYSDETSLNNALATAARDENQQIVVGAYEIDVEIVNGEPSPLKLREKIRAEGPTTSYGENVTSSVPRAA